MEMVLGKYTPTYLKGTHPTNAVVGVLQSLFIGDELSFLKKNQAFTFALFFVLLWEKVRGWVGRKFEESRRFGCRHFNTGSG